MEDNSVTVGKNVLGHCWLHYSETAVAVHSCRAKVGSTTVLVLMHQCLANTGPLSDRQH